MRLSFAALALMLFASSAAAQTLESRASFSAIGGAARTYDDESSLGRGWVIGGAYDHVLFGTTRLEISAELLTHNRDSGYFRSKGNTAVAGASLLHRFGRGHAQPYVFGGLTVGHHSATNTLATDSVPVSSTNPGTRFGFGVAVKAPNRVEIIPEVRMNTFFTNTGSDPWTLLSFGVRIGFRM